MFLLSSLQFGPSNSESSWHFVSFPRAPTATNWALASTYRSLIKNDWTRTATSTHTSSWHTVWLSTAIPLSSFSQQNLVCTSPLPYLFEVVSFPQFSPTKPCVHLTSTLFIPSGLFPSGFPNKTFCAPHLYPIYSKWSLSLMFPQQNLLCTSLLPCLFQVVCFPQVSPTKLCVYLTFTLFIPHAPRITSFFLFYHPNNIW